MTISGIDLVLCLAALPVLAISLYLAVLALLARQKQITAPVAPRTRFEIVVPAHDEETTIARTIESLVALDYPRELFRVLVVADNCRDRTAERAAAAGAGVLVRDEAGRRGKGYALAAAFDHCLSGGFADAVVVVDADTVVSRNLLRAFASRFESQAAAVQAEYGVLNSRSSWRTRLMTIALAAFHGVRSLARERLGLSCGLRGNGMGLAAATLRAVPYRAFSIVEDVEYGLQLGYAGYRVQYVPDARVLGDMAVSEMASRSQRHRWERGRLALAYRHVPSLLAGAWRRRDPVLLDLALDLLVPPLAEIVAASVIGCALCLAAIRLGGRVSVAPVLWAAAAGGLLLYVGRGWRHSGSGLRGLADLLWAPAYVAWKIAQRLRGKRSGEDDWIRTTREVKM